MRTPRAQEQVDAKERIRQKIQQFYQMTAHARQNMGWVAWIRDIIRYGISPDPEQLLTA